MTFWSRNEIGDNQEATRELKELFENKDYFDYPKPKRLLSRLVEITTSSDDKVLDFFSGSATTAHAVMQLNAEDSGNRKFIMVQLPEEVEKESEAFKAGFDSIADIGRERIRRAGEKIKREFTEKYEAELAVINKKLAQGSFDDDEDLEAEKAEVEAKLEHIRNLDTGFRVFRVDTTNMRDVRRHPSEVKKEDMFDFVHNIYDNRSADDILIQVMLQMGLELTLPITTRTIGANKIFIVQENALVACFDKKIDFSIVDKIASIRPLRAVFRDESFRTDKDRINVEEVFKRLSPSTEIRVL